MKLKLNSDWPPQSRSDNTNENLSRLLPQEDAIYDYERVPAAWSALDEQPDMDAYGDPCLNNDERVKLGKRAS